MWFPGCVAANARVAKTSGVAIQLTFSLADLAEAQQILATLAAVERPAASSTLITRTHCPPGHTYRELNDARLRGDLQADLTPKGLLTTEEALVAYRLLRSQRRRRARSTDAKVTDLTAHRIRVLAKAGIPTKRPTE